MSAEVNIDKSIDLSGDVCPYTFVKSKLALEALGQGQVLSVTVDNGESAANVPKSVELEGHEVLNVAQEGKAWNILIKKANE